MEIVRKSKIEREDRWRNYSNAGETRDGFKTKYIYTWCARIIMFLKEGLQCDLRERLL